MSIEVVMPRLSDTMEEGTIVKWLKRIGDPVAIGDVVAEVETDKATMELEAFDAGVVAELRVAEGQAAPVGAVIAVLEAGAGRPAARPAGDAAAAAMPSTPAAPPPPTAQTRPAPDPRTAPAPPSAPAPPVAATPRSGAAPVAGGRLGVSPRARRLASERGVDLAALRGSGPGGRIVASDLEPAGATPAPPGRGRRVELGKMRRTTAARMAAAKRDVPHFYASSDIAADALVALKAALRARGGEWQGLTFTPLLAKAVGLALREVPELNASWADGSVVLHEEVNVGLAVAVDDGLIVPVLRGCDVQPLAALVAAAQGLVERARSGRFAGDDLVGATFTVSNLGMYPVSTFAAVVNPPHAGILAVGAVRRVPVVRDTTVVPGDVLGVTLSCDHRVVDGVTAGRFLAAFKKVVETPNALLD